MASRASQAQLPKIDNDITGSAFRLHPARTHPACPILNQYRLHTRTVHGRSSDVSDIAPDFQKGRFRVKALR